MPDDKRMKNPEFAAGYNSAMAEVRAAREAKVASKKKARCVRAKQLASNEWRVTEEVYYGEPDETRVILDRVSTVNAEDEVRLFYENMMGPNRLGDSGMPW